MKPEDTKPVPETLSERRTHAKVVAKTTVYEEPKKVGDIVKVDEITFRNLEKKGRLVAASDEEIAAFEKPAKKGDK